MTTFYWMFTTGAGVAGLIAAVLGLVVGFVVVAQTISATTMDLAREYGTLKAMGAPNSYVYKVIMKQAAISAVKSSGSRLPGALAGDPEIILADEPTAALDSVTGRNVMEMMTELAHERGRAVVSVTHDSRVLSFADRNVKIEDGLIAVEEPVITGNG